MRKFLSINGFLFALLLAIAAAWLFPEPGASGGWLQPELILRYGIAVIFFNVGALLPLERMREDLAEWRLHILVQAGVFLFLPVMVLIALPFLTRDSALVIGFIYLAMLPTTVSTAIVFVMQMRGNVTGAVFNTSLSNILAMVLVPAWMVWHLQSGTQQTVELAPLFARIAMLQLLPLCVGNLVRLVGSSFFDKHRKWLGRTNNAIILFIVYASFCNAVKGGVFDDLGWKAIGVTAVLCAALVVAAHGLMWASAAGIHLSRASRWCAMFVGGQKSLAVGAAMVPVIFGQTEEASLILLPVLLYHFLQLLGGALFLRFTHERTAGGAVIDVAAR